MIRTFASAAAAAALAALAVPSFAQAPAEKAVKASNPDEVICEKQEVTGSRLAVKRICKTRAQWAQEKLQDRQELERVQVQRGMKDGG